MLGVMLGMRCVRFGFRGDFKLRDVAVQRNKCAIIVYFLYYFFAILFFGLYDLLNCDNKIY